ncbi:MAG: primosomal protein N' [Pseudomonadota bacterium]|nr:primosomal protein N' [Pseudomonadota bacterium]
MAGEKPSSVVQVLVAMALPQALLDYTAPEGMILASGDYVEVPLGKRRAVGMVHGPGGGSVDPARLRSIIRRFDLPPMPEKTRRLVDWVAAYCMVSAGAVLRMALGPPEALEAPRHSLLYRRSATSLPDGFRLTPARHAVLEYLERVGDPLSAADLAGAASASPAIVRAMADTGVLETVLQAAESPVPVLDTKFCQTVFSPAQQQEAVNILTRHEDERAFSVTVLDGVTGSGKTEVFMEAVAHALEQGRQALVLLPEIALGPQVVERFTRRFGQAPLVWHSDLTPARRRDTWRAVATGRTQVIVGARSALFLPFPALGLIVVDEEHDGSYKQEEGVCYHARDMAVVRASLEKIPAVLVSATPSLETLTNVENGKYSRLHLPDRHGSALMPDIRLLDLRTDRPAPRRWLCPTLCTAIDETLVAGEQALLFLNRRGYAPLTLCRTCGHRLQCPQCTAWLVQHRTSGRLHCHHCGHAEPPPALCPSCGEADSLVACGPGVERIAEEVAERFPQARTLVMASDTLTTAAQMEEALQKIRRRDVDLIVGTQMVAKGHHFPALTLVGVVDADIGLSGGDLRAAERTFQLLQQVAGRAGRADRPGRVFLQTFQPHHPVMQALKDNDRDAFMAREGDERRRHGMPPWGRLVALIVSGPDAEAADRVAYDLGRQAPRTDGVVVLGPAPAPLAIVRGKHRRRLLLKAPRGVNVQALVCDWLAHVTVPSKVTVKVDVDPYGFL